jgi:hypothetical protein
MTRTLEQCKNEIYKSISDNGVHPEVAIWGVCSDNFDYIEILSKDVAFQNRCKALEHRYIMLLQSDLDQVRRDNQEKGNTRENRYRQDQFFSNFQSARGDESPTIPAPTIEER